MVDVNGTITGVNGFQVAGVAAGLKTDNRLDFALVVSDRACTAAGVFTTNQVKAAPVTVDLQKLAQNSSSMRAVVVNTGCANACTGELGVDNAHTTARWAAEELNARPEEVLVLSTGVIGTHLPMDRIERGIELASRSLGDDWGAAAAAIMTTDTRPKQASAQVIIDGQTITVAGIAKGAGMIAPNMATMLGVIVTDAALTPAQAQDALQFAVGLTFNCIVVDGDMSTNDTVLLLANGASGVTLDQPQATGRFNEALLAVCHQLAQAIVRDGEGVTRFISLTVKNAPDDASARQIANTIATSPLVKTAFYGGDANWGRIIAAAGRAGVPFDPNRAQLWIAAGEVDRGELRLFANGTPADYDEAAAADIMAQPSISVWLDCGAGKGSATVWTCDLSHDYVSINGHYRS